MRVVLVAMLTAYGPIGRAETCYVRCKYRKVRRQHPSAVYDPGQQGDLQHHCAFATMLAAAGHKNPTLQDVREMRRLLAAMWAQRPQALASTAAIMGMSSSLYLHRLQATLWGGLPDIDLFCSAVRIKLVVVSEEGVPIWTTGDLRVCDAVERDHHYTLLRSSGSLQRGCRAKQIFKKLNKAYYMGQRQWSTTVMQGRAGMPLLSLRSRSPRRQDATEAFARSHPGLVVRLPQGMRCRLCSNWLTARHLQSQRHEARFGAWMQQREAVQQRRPDLRAPPSRQQQTSLRMEPAETRERGITAATSQRMELVVLRPCVQVQSVQPRATRSKAAAKPQRRNIESRPVAEESAKEEEAPSSSSRDVQSPPSRQAPPIPEEEQQPQEEQQDQSYADDDIPDYVHESHIACFLKFRRKLPMLLRAQGLDPNDYDFSGHHHPSKKPSAHEGGQARAGMQAASSSGQPYAESLIKKEKATSLEDGSTLPAIADESNNPYGTDPESEAAQSPLEEMPDDELRAQMLSLATTVKQEGPVPPTPVGGWWVVLCSAGVRRLQARMGKHTTLQTLAYAIAAAMKWQAAEVLLAMDGHLLPLQSTLAQTQHPYQFQVIRRTPLPPNVKPRMTKRATIHMDLGDIHEDSEVSEGAQKNDSSGVGVSDLAATASDANAPLLPLEEEREEMQRQDVSVDVIRIKRPRDELCHQIYRPVTVDHYLDALAVTKRVRRSGFVLYQQVDGGVVLEEGSKYFLLWNKSEARAGGSLTTTEPCSEGTSVPASTWGSRPSDEARDALDYLESVLHRIRSANSLLEAFRRKPQTWKVISLADLRVPVDARAGEGKHKVKAAPVRWETTTGEQGLQVYSRLVVKVQDAADTVLKQLPNEQFAQGAIGFTLFSWDTWTGKAHLRSEKPLLSVLPGRRKAQVMASSQFQETYVSEHELVMVTPQTETSAGIGDGQKRFTKVVTMVDHTSGDTRAVCEVDHRGVKIQMQPAFEHQLFVDLYEDSVMRTQDWSQKGLRLTVETGIQAWQIKEGYEVQWPTLRYQAVTARVSVVVRASPLARVALLKVSGKGLLYVREQIGGCAVTRDLSG